MKLFFEIEIFIIKYVLDHSDSIATKKFLTKNYCLCHFFDKEWPKLEIFVIFLVRNFFSKKFLYPPFEFFLAVLLSRHTYVYF